MKPIKSVMLTLVTLGGLSTGAFAEPITLPSEVLASAKFSEQLAAGNQDADRRWQELTEEQRLDSEFFRGVFLDEEDLRDEPGKRYHISLYSVSEFIDCGFSLEFNDKTKAVKILAKGYECHPF